MNDSSLMAADTPAWAVAKQTAQEAPFLTHLVRHHGQTTLTAPPNFGRRRQFEEPAASTSDTPQANVKKKKKKKAKKRGVNSEIFDAVANAGRTTPTPPAHGEGAGQEGPPMERASPSALGAELGGMRGSLRPAVAEEVVVASRVRYSRGSIFESAFFLSNSYPTALTCSLADLDELGDDLPPFATRQHHCSSSSYAPVAEPLPSSPPPAYPSRSRSPSPMSPLDQTFDMPAESSTLAESPILPPAEVLPVDDPFVLAWEADRAAGLSLDERIERDLARRLRSATTPSSSHPLPPSPLPLPGAPSPPPSTRLPSSLSGVDVDQAERQEIAEAEANQDAPRVARALSVRAGRRFAEAASRRREREIRLRLRDTLDEVDVADDSTASVSVRTEEFTAAMERRTVVTEEEEEESEVDEEESAPARLARAVSVNASRHFAEAAERRIVLERAQRLVSLAESPRSSLPLSTQPSPPTPEPQVDPPPPSPFIPRPFGLTSSPRNSGLTEASQPSSTPSVVEAPRPPPLAPRPSASSRLASTSTSTSHSSPRPPTPETPAQPSPAEDCQGSASKEKARATDDSEVAEPSPPRRSAPPPPPPSRLSSVFSGAYPPPEGPPPPLAHRLGISRAPSLPPESNPSILSYLSQQERDGLADPLQPDRFPTTPIARIPGRFPSLRRPAPPSPPSRPPPLRPPPPPPPLFTIPVDSAPIPRRARRPLPVPPGPTDRVDAYTVLREQAAAAERAALTAEGQAAASQSDYLAVDAEAGAGTPPRPPSAASSVEVPLPLEPGEDGEPSSQAAAARSARDDFVYTDLDLLLARLEDNNASNYDVRPSSLLSLTQPADSLHDTGTSPRRRSPRSRPSGRLVSRRYRISRLRARRARPPPHRQARAGQAKVERRRRALRGLHGLPRALPRRRVCGRASEVPTRVRSPLFRDSRVELTISPTRSFHAECLTKWLLRSQQCPVCRTDAFEPRIVDI